MERTGHDMNKYVFILNDKGERETSLLIGVHAADEQATLALAQKDYPSFIYILGDEDMQQLFYQNKRYLNGEWLDPVVVEVSAEEIQAKEAAQVASEYETKFKAIDDEIIRAEIIDKDTEYANELRQQREALQVEFMEKRGEL
jgi:hypothetical protein